MSEPVWKKRAVVGVAYCGGCQHHSTDVHEVMWTLPRSYTQESGENHKRDYHSRNDMNKGFRCLSCGPPTLALFAEPTLTKREAAGKCICGECGKTHTIGDTLWALPLSDMVKSHDVNKSGNLNYRCLDCGPTKLNMVRVYAAGDAWECGRCNNRFGTKTKAVTHVNMDHNAGANVIDKPAPKVSHRCMVCGFGTQNYDEMDTHLLQNRKCRRKHLGSATTVPTKEAELPPTCEICGTGSPTREESITHEIDKHPDETRVLHVCKICNHWNWTLKSMHKHFKSAHPDCTTRDANIIDSVRKGAEIDLLWNKQKLFGWAICGGCGEKQQGSTTVWTIPDEYRLHDGKYFEEKYSCSNKTNEGYRCLDCGPLTPLVKVVMKQCSGTCREQPEVVEVDGEFWHKLKTEGSSGCKAEDCTNEIREIDYFWGVVPEGEEPDLVTNKNVNKYRCLECGPPETQIEKVLEEYEADGAGPPAVGLLVVRADGLVWTKENTHSHAICGGCKKRFEGDIDFWGGTPEGKEPANGNFKDFRCMECGPPQPDADPENIQEAAVRDTSDLGGVPILSPETAPVVQEEDLPMKLMKKKDADAYACIGRAWYKLRHLVSGIFGEGNGPKHPWEIYTVKDAEVAHGQAYEYKANCKCCGVKIEDYFTNIAAALATDMTFTKTALEEMGVKMPTKKMSLATKLLFGWWIFPIRGARKTIGKLASWPWEKIIPITVIAAVIGGGGYLIQEGITKGIQETEDQLCATPETVGVVKEAQPAGDFCFIMIEDGKMIRIKVDEEHPAPKAGTRGYTCKRDHFHAHAASIDQGHEGNTTGKEEESGTVGTPEVPEVRKDDTAAPKGGSGKEEDTGEDFH